MLARFHHHLGCFAVNQLKKRPLLCLGFRGLGGFSAGPDAWRFSELAHDFPCSPTPHPPRLSPSRHGEDGAESWIASAGAASTDGSSDTGSTPNNQPQGSLVCELEHFDFSHRKTVGPRQEGLPVDAGVVDVAAPDGRRALRVQVAVVGHEEVAPAPEAGAAP